MLDAVSFINFMLSSGIIKLDAALASGAQAGEMFFTKIGFDAATAKQLTGQLMSLKMRVPPSPGPPGGATNNFPLTGPGRILPVGPAGIGTPGLTTSGAPRLQILATGYPFVARG